MTIKEVCEDEKELKLLEEIKKYLAYNEYTGIFTWIRKKSQNTKIGKIAGTLTKKGYIVIIFNGKSYPAHRLAWLYYYSSFPEEQIDHRDRNKSNNAILNLRKATNLENSQNKNLFKNNSTGYMGVSLRKETGKYRAYIRIENKLIHLGQYDNPEKASIAYITAKKQYHPFHNLNLC